MKKVHLKKAAQLTLSLSLAFQPLLPTIALAEEQKDKTEQVTSEDNKDDEKKEPLEESSEEQIDSQESANEEQKNESEESSTGIKELNEETSDQTFAAKAIISGNYLGGVEWTVDTETGVMHIAAGEILNTNPGPQSIWVDEFAKYNLTIDQITKIVIDGPLKLAPNSQYLFSDFVNLEEIENGNLIDTSDVGAMQYMFQNNKKLVKLDVSNWNTSKVYDMQGVFLDNELLTTLDVSKWDTSQVTNMVNMFSRSYVLKELDVSRWNVSKVTSMTLMFTDMRSLEKLDLSLWELSPQLKNLSGVFRGTSNLSFLDVSNWNTENIESLSTTFSNMSNLTELDVSGWDTGNVTDLDGTFSGTKSLKSLDVSNWNTSNVKKLTRTFAMMSSLEELPISEWDTSNVTEMKLTFQNDLNLTALDVSKWDVSNVENTSTMFYGMAKLENLDVSKWNTSKLQQMDSMFQGTKKISELDLTNWNTSQVTNKVKSFDTMSELKVLKLGKNVVSIEETALPNVPNNSEYSGKWQAVGTGTIADPAGPKYTSEELMTQYTGDLADTYVWAKAEQGGKITVKYVNEKDEEISPAKTIAAGISGEAYDASTEEFKLEIADYYLDTDNLPSNATGTFTDTEQTVIYKYKADQTSLAIKNASTIYVGDNWTAADNFVSATDKTGASVPLTGIKVTGTVNNTVPGNYEITYTNGQKVEKATITVLEDLSTIEAIGSTLRVGDSWEPKDNFVSAKDKEGNPLNLDEIVVEGTVDTSKSGIYYVVYKNGKKQLRVTIVVNNNLSSMEVKNSKLFVGDSWTGKDNFVKARDKDGNWIDYDESMITSGSVDVTTPGLYKVVYTSSTSSATAEIQVVADQSSIKVKDSVIYVGDIWNGKDNFVSATNMDGATITYHASMINGATIDTSKPGKHEIVYTFQSKTATATIEVKADQTAIKVQDSELYVGDTWKAEDNFVSGTDKDGKPVTFKAEMATGTVDTTKAGTYKVTYTNGTAKAEATIVVKVDQTSIKVKNSVLFIGATWKAEDNFVSATDKDGKPVTFKAEMATGTVDTTKAGTYKVTYTNGTAKAEATIEVNADQTTIQVKNSELYVGATWKAEDNFVSATDKDGKPVTFKAEMATGTVDTTKAGTYKVTYTNGIKTAEATIVVKADQTSIAVKDSELYVGDNWKAEDNFVSGTDKDGKPVTFKAEMATGTVDTTKAGTYTVTYTNGTKTAVATVKVKADQTTIKVKNSTLLIGAAWTAEDNFVSATDKDGKAVTFKAEMAVGTVDTTTAGTYKITYTNGSVTAEATIIVKADQTSITVKDSELYVGDTWKAEDNFVSATDKDGNPVTFNLEMATGTVDTTKTGTYKVTYTNGSETAEATIVVKADQASIAVKDSELYVGDTWKAEDNFVSATDKDGNPVTFNAEMATNTVDTTKAGTYKVTYKNGAATSEATIEVKEKAAVVSTLTILYRDVEGNGLASHPDETLSGEIGTAYIITPAKVPGYHWVKTEVTAVAEVRSLAVGDDTQNPVIDEKTGEVSGTYVENNPEISFVYEKDEETPEPGKPEPGTPEPGTPEPGTPEPGKPEPGTPEPGKPNTAKPNTTNPATANPKPTNQGGKLPQTDEVKTNNSWVGIGTLMVGATLAYFSNWRKRKN